MGFKHFPVVSPVAFFCADKFKRRIVYSQFISSTLGLNEDPTREDYTFGAVYRESGRQKA